MEISACFNILPSMVCESNAYPEVFGNRDLRQDGGRDIDPEAAVEELGQCTQEGAVFLFHFCHDHIHGLVHRHQLLPVPFRKAFDQGGHFFPQKALNGPFQAFRRNTGYHAGWDVDRDAVVVFAGCKLVRGLKAVVVNGAYVRVPGKF